MNATDFILIGFILLGLIMGVLRGWWRVLIGFAVFSIGLVIFMNCGTVDYLTNWVKYDLIDFLVNNGWMQPIRLDMTESLGVVFQVNTVEEAALLLQNFGLDASYLSVNIDLLCEFLSLAIVILPWVLVSFLASTLLYHLLFKWIFPKKIRKCAISRIFGSAFGVVGYTTLGLVLISIVYSPLEGLNATFIGPIQNTNSELYQAISSLVPSSIDQFQSIGKTLGSVVEVINPTSQTSIICRPLLNFMNSIGLDPFYMISNTVVETGQNVSFKDTFSQFLDDVNESIILKAGSSSATVN